MPEFWPKLFCIPNGEAMTEIVTVSDAARRLGEMGDVVSSSVLQRYIRTHGIRTFKSKNKTMLSLAELVSHRRGNPKCPGGRNLPAILPGKGGSDVPPMIEAGYLQPPSEHDGKARKVAAEATLKELELAKRQGLLLERAKVEDAAADAVGGMIATLLGQMNVTAESIAEITRHEPRFIRPLLRKMVDDAVAEFRKTLQGL